MGIAVAYNPCGWCSYEESGERCGMCELTFRRKEWISVEDRLPERAEDYLCRCIIKDNFDYPFYMVLRYILIDENPHFQHECENGLKVTHWMPLPEAPKMKGGAE